MSKKIVLMTVEFVVGVPEEIDEKNLCLGMNLSDIVVQTRNMEVIDAFVVSHDTIKTEVYDAPRPLPEISEESLKRMFLDNNEIIQEDEEGSSYRS